MLTLGNIFVLMLFASAGAWFWHATVCARGRWNGSNSIAPGSIWSYWTTTSRFVA